MDELNQDFLEFIKFLETQEVDYLVVGVPADNALTIMKTHE